MRQVMKLEAGFTLIEIVSVIVILGFLAIIVVPRLMSVTDEASQAMVESVAVTLGAASARNYSVRIEVNARGDAISNCDQIGELLVAGWGVRYADFTISDTPIAALDTVECTVTDPQLNSAQFTGHGID